VLHVFKFVLGHGSFFQFVVAAKVGAKTGFKSGILGKAAAFAANKLVTDEKVIQNLAATLIEKIKIGTSDMGITATTAKVRKSIIFIL
jgi:hypothetical protein